MSLTTQFWHENLAAHKQRGLTQKLGTAKSTGKSTGKSVGTLFAATLIAATALVGLVAPASAAQLRLGNIDVQVDTTLSVGVSVRTEEREDRLVPARHGGPADMTRGIDPNNLAMDCGTAAEPSRYARMADGPMPGMAAPTCMYDNTTLTTLSADPALASVFANPDNVSSMELYNYDSSMNTDDGRLNFDDGDLTGGTFKLTSDIEADFGSRVRFFARVSGFYDAVLEDDSSFDRTGLTENGDRAVITDIDMLDFYVDFDLEAGGNPFLLRVGRQVINWGEATFFLGGNSVFSPIDVAAIRRPGAEIKEALLPVEAVYGSYALSDSLTLEAYYGKWDDYKIDNAGTPFANSDAVEPTSAGNGARFYVGNGAYSGANKRNCAAASSANPAAAAYGAAMDAVFGTCQAGDAVDYLTANAVGNVEASRQAIANTVVRGRPEAGYTLYDTDFLARGEDDEPEASDNYGLALRWYAENLNSTEFGLFYQNYTSRIPYISSIARQPVAGPSTTHVTNSLTTRGVPLTGCAASLAVSTGGRAGTVGAMAEAAARAEAEAVDGATPETIAAAGTAAFNAAVDATGPTPGAFARQTANVVGGLAAIDVADPTGLNRAVRETVWDTEATRDAIIAAAIPNLQAQLGALPAIVAPLDPIARATSRFYGDNAFATSALQGVVNGALASELDDTIAQITTLGCVATLAQASVGPLGGLIPAGGLTVLGRYQTELFAEYPEDIEVYGFSFNTTAFGWGVQGEIAYRPNMPLQLDGDSVSIVALAASCAWEGLGFLADGAAYDNQTIPSQCGQWNQVFPGYVREQLTFIDIGTTATFTRSNPLINFLGADLGILLTEIGYINMPDADHYRQSNDAALAADIPRLSNQCTSGSDLPLGGLFSLDPRGPLTAGNALDGTAATTQCRATEDSSGIVLFGSLQYNNAFGSAWGVSPSIAYQRGIDGRSPSPAGSFIKDNESLSLRVTANYQSEWTVSLGYTLFDGDVLYNRNVDRDFVSLSTSYAF